MGKIRRDGFMFIWWIGDHAPRHVHVFDKNGKLITRVDLDTMQAMDIPRIPGRLLKTLLILKKEGRL